MIPLLIHQIGKHGSKRNDSWEKYNPGFRHTFFTDEECEDLSRKLSLPKLTSVYDSLLQGAQRADVCRLMVLYMYGGIYADTDVIAYGSIRKVIPKHTTFFLTEWGSFEFFGSAPRHPFLLMALNDSITHIYDEIISCAHHKKCCKSAHACIIKLTGPKSFFSSVVRAGRKYNCSNKRWIPRDCANSSDPLVRGYFRCEDEGLRTNPYRSTLCGIARHADCRNSGMVLSGCERGHYSKVRQFFNFSAVLS